MSTNKIILILKKYQLSKRDSKMQRQYLNLFEKKMLYRTTKTENLQTTMNIVDKVLNRLAAKS
jgi:hypothetical protein